MSRWFLPVAALVVAFAASPPVLACEAMLETEEYTTALATIEQNGWPVAEITCPSGSQLHVEPYHGQVTMQCFDADENLVGPGRSAWVNYDGRILVTDYNYQDGQMHGRYTTRFHATGMIVDDGRYANGTANGWWRSYDWESGDLRSEHFYVDGKLHGFSRRYGAGEVLVEESRYADGVLHGLTRRWYENGHQAWEGTYVAGVLEGPARAWHQTGQLHWDGTYDNGVYEGAFTEWFDDGTRKRQGWFRKGAETGNWTVWSSDGTWTVQEFPTAADRVRDESAALIVNPGDAQGLEGTVLSLDNVFVEGEVLIID